jgi:hypothetical protein
MCSGETDCGSQASCVSGRCVARGATPAVANAKRQIFAPVEVGWVRRGDATGADVAALGGADGAIVFLRFAVPLAPEVNVVEAYLLLDRAPGIDVDPATYTLHAARVAGAWDARSLSWARQPSVVEVGAPVTRVFGAGASLVRLDVRSIVERWRRRDADEHGIAVVAEGQGGAALPLALEPLDVPADRDDPLLVPPTALATQAPSPFEPRQAPPVTVGDPRRQVSGPRLELYLR